MSKIIKLQNPSILASYLVSQLFILIPGGDSTENHENCTKMEISQCESQNLFCCFIRQNSSCCSEKDYFNQFPKLSNAQSEARITPFDLMGFLEIVSFMGMTLLIVCCLLCSCCPNCAKHRRGDARHRYFIVATLETNRGSNRGRGSKSYRNFHSLHRQ